MNFKQYAALYAVAVFLTLSIASYSFAEVNAQKWDVNLYGQDFQLVPSVLKEDPEYERGPSWELVRQHIPTLMPDALKGEEELGKSDVLEKVTEMKNSYSQSHLEKMQALAQELIVNNWDFVLTGMNPETDVAYFEHVNNVAKADDSTRMSFMRIFLYDNLSRRLKDKVQSYNETAAKPIQSIDAIEEANLHYEYASALAYLEDMLKADMGDEN